MSPTALDDRALNRATLARQLLLEPSASAPVDAVEHLVGLQAQNPRDPYLALWSRLAGFDPLALSAAVEDRRLVRIVVMRGTIHLLSAWDAAQLRPLTQPVLDAEVRRHPQFRPLLAGVDLAPVLRFAAELLGVQPLDGPRLRAALAARFPGIAAEALAYACRCHLPLVQVPPRGLWRRTAQVTYAPLEAWTGLPLAERPSIDDAVRRYLRAFGPATVADVASWSRLAGMGAVLERLRPELRTFVDGRRRELFDVEDGPLPDADAPAPVRFLPEYDNVLLSYADRTRFGLRDARLTAVTGPVRGTVLVDGRLGAVWRTEADKRAKRSTLVVEHVPLPRRARAELEAAAHGVAEFWSDPTHTHDVRLAPVP